MQLFPNGDQPHSSISPPPQPLNPHHVVYHFFCVMIRSPPRESPQLLPTQTLNPRFPQCLFSVNSRGQRNRCVFSFPSPILCLTQQPYSIGESSPGFPQCCILLDIDSKNLRKTDGTTLPLEHQSSSIERQCELTLCSHPCMNLASERVQTPMRVYRMHLYFNRDSGVRT